MLLSCCLFFYPMGIMYQSLMQQLISECFLHFIGAIAFSFQCHWFSNYLGERYLRMKPRSKAKLYPFSVFTVMSLV